MTKKWNEIQFDTWSYGDVSILINHYGEGPIILELGSSSGNEWMTSDKARAVAAKLIEAADAVDKAGKLPHSLEEENTALRSAAAAIATRVTNKVAELARARQPTESELYDIVVTAIKEAKT